MALITSCLLTAWIPALVTALSLFAFIFFLRSLQKLLFPSLVLWLVPVTSRELQEQRCLLPACSSFGVPLSRAPTLCVVPEES